MELGPEGEGKPPSLEDGELELLLLDGLVLLLEELLEELLELEDELEDELDDELELDDDGLELDDDELGEDELLLGGVGGCGVVGFDALGQPASTRQAQLRETGKISLRTLLLIPLSTLFDNIGPAYFFRYDGLAHR